MATALLLAVALVACGSDDAAGPPERSARPNRVDSTSLASARIDLTDVVDTRSMPTGLARRSGDDAYYVVTRDGLVQRWAGGRSHTTLLDLRKDVSVTGEGGAFDLAFSLDRRRLIVSYAQVGNHHLRVVSIPIGADGRRTGAPTSLVDIGDGGEIHNGGGMEVLPNGDLLLGVGDGGELTDVAGRSRRPSSLRGRILRYRGLARTATRPTEPVTAAMGLRNPWRSFRDAKSGTLWIGDVGQARSEEVDRLDHPERSVDVDFGWDLTEGFQRARGLPPPRWQRPVVVSSHDATHCAIVGGPIVRDASLPQLSGAHVLGDYCSGDVRFVRIVGGKAVEQRKLALPDGARVVSFAEGPEHEVYVIRSDGKISRLDPGRTRLARSTAPLVHQSGPQRTGPLAICGLPAAVASYAGMQGKPPAEVKALATDLGAALAFYQGVQLPTAAEAPFSRLGSDLQTYLQILQAAGYDTSAPSVQKALAGGRSGAADFAALSKIEAAACA